MDTIGVAASFLASAVQLVLAVPRQPLRELLPQALIRDDQVDVVADLAADACIRRPTADQDRWLEVVAERVLQRAELAFVVRAEDRHRRTPS